MIFPPEAQVDFQRTVRVSLTFDTYGTADQASALAERVRYLTELSLHKPVEITGLNISG